MTNRYLIGCCLLLLHTACTAETPSAGYPATVTAVHDGDTLRVTDRHGRKQRVRLAYIDAPELDQAGGTASRDALRNLLLRRQVQVEVYDTDSYQRQVARISLNNQDINLTQLQNGHAWHYRSIAKKQQHPDAYRAYAEAESRARSSRYGLWQQSSPTAPWQFRYQNRQQLPH